MSYHNKKKINQQELSPLFRGFFLERKIFIKNKILCCIRKLSMPLFKLYVKQNNTSI